jgi:hypothetical protein
MLLHVWLRERCIVLHLLLLLLRCAPSGRRAATSVAAGGGRGTRHWLRLLLLQLLL